MESDFVSRLKSELVRRTTKQPSYSLRSFARTLDVSPALLSLVLNRRRKPSLEFRQKVAGAIGLEDRVPDDANFFERDLKRINGWVSYAILSLVDTFDFRADENWIARRLKISVHEVKDAVKKLEEAGLLLKTEHRWRQNSPPLRVNNRASTASTRQFQKALLEKASESLENDPPSVRDHSSMTFAVSSKDLAQIKMDIREFRIRLSEKYEKKRRLDEVYNLTIQFSPVSKR